MNNKEKKSERKCPLCKKCQFYDKEKDACKVKKTEECSETEINNCTDFLISEKLVYF